MQIASFFLPRLRGRCRVATEGGAICSELVAPPSTTSWSPSPVNGGGNIFAVIAALLAAILLLAPARADERILGFSSDLDIHTDGTMRVTEVIRVRSENVKIVHGIYRDLPTTYKTAMGDVIGVDMTVAGVERDGAPEPFSIDPLSNGKRIKIGSADRTVDPGEHTYRIVYDITNEIGFYKDHDEIYWNVNGVGWPFPADSVSAVVRLPAGARVLDYTGYTGVQGDRGKDFSAERVSDTEVDFKTTRSLDPGENLTVVVTWPKGVVTPPTAQQKTDRYLRQNLPVFVAGLGVIGLFAYYMWAWFKVGRDPPKGPIVPTFHPPRDLGPADLRYIRRMGYDRKAFAAAMVDLGVKGAIKLEDDGHDFTVVRKGAGTGLTAGEPDVLDELLSGRDTISTKRGENYTRWTAAQNALKKALNAENGNKIFVGNQGYFWFGVAITLAIAVLAAVLSPNPSNAIGVSLFIGIWVSVFGFLVVRATQGGGSFGGGFASLMRIVALFFIFIPFSISTLVASSKLTEIMSFWVPAAIIVAAVLNVWFLHLLKAPTLDGRKLMDEIEGFRMYLGAAEQNRLNVLNPPQETPQLFEKFLPYALALDVENEWNHRFASVLAHAAEQAGTSGGGYYSPLWYSGPRLSRIATGGFAGALGSALATAAASASTAPGSSSGMGGGGFSGGGGGGGGGGGW